MRTSAIIAFGAALCLGAAPALAHTTIHDQATEGVTADNSFKLAHTCQLDDGSWAPVLAESAVLPIDSPVLTASDGSTVGSLSQVIQTTDLRGLAKPIQDKSVFKSLQLKLDSLGNVIGWSGTGGAMTAGSNAPGRIPFQFAAPKVQANSCAVALAVKINIADICVPGLGMSDSVQDGKVNLWIPDNGSQFATVGKANGADEGIGAPATLTINRNLTTDPLPSSCGAGITVTVTSNPKEVDANLPIPGYWP